MEALARPHGTANLQDQERHEPQHFTASFNSPGGEPFGNSQSVFPEHCRRLFLSTVFDQRIVNDVYRFHGSGLIQTLFATNGRSVWIKVPPIMAALSLATIPRRLTD